MTRLFLGTDATRVVLLGTDRRHYFSGALSVPMPAARLQDFLVSLPGPMSVLVRNRQDWAHLVSAAGIADPAALVPSIWGAWLIDDLLLDDPAPADCPGADAVADTLRHAWRVTTGKALAEDPL